MTKSVLVMNVYFQQSAEDLAINSVYHKRSKHIEIKYHRIREHVDLEGEHYYYYSHIFPRFAVPALQLRYFINNLWYSIMGEHRTAILIHVRTADQSADIFTKALTGPVFECHRKRVLGQWRKASASVTEDDRRKRPR